MYEGLGTVPENGLVHVTAGGAAAASTGVADTNELHDNFPVCISYAACEAL